MGCSSALADGMMDGAYAVPVFWFDARSWNFNMETPIKTRSSSYMHHFKFYFPCFQHRVEDDTCNIDLRQIFAFVFCKINRFLLLLT